MVVVRSQARAACARDWLAFLVWRKMGRKGTGNPRAPPLLSSRALASFSLVGELV